LLAIAIGLAILIKGAGAFSLDRLLASSAGHEKAPALAEAV
jgi:hypothetical protein